MTAEKAVTLSAAHGSEREKYYEALITEVENACIEGQHSKAWHFIADISGKKRNSPMESQLTPRKNSAGP